MRVRLIEGAKRDFKEGLRWYRKHSDQAAAGFIEMTNTTTVRILKDPTQHRPLEADLRVIRYDTYPYRLIYRIKAGGIISIVAIAHDKRREGYWRRRTD
jgi:plasmid stabilization system protein ParE